MIHTCSDRRKLSAAVLGGFLACIAGQASGEGNPPAKLRAACFAEVSIEGDAEEAALACASLAHVVSYFAEAGFELVPRVTVSFVEEMGDLVRDERCTEAMMPASTSSRLCSSASKPKRGARLEQRPND
jgi:hypothetical protein